MNAYAERFIGSLRRERLKHIITLKESSMKRIWKTPLILRPLTRSLSLEKDSWVSRLWLPVGLHQRSNGVPGPAIFGEQLVELEGQTFVLQFRASNNFAVTQPA